MSPLAPASKTSFIEFLTMCPTAGPCLLHIIASHKPIPFPLCCRFSRQHREGCRNAHHEVSPVLPMKDASTVLPALTKVFCVVSFAGRDAVYGRGVCRFATESVGTTLSA